jgi:hypothetical protein
MTTAMSFLRASLVVLAAVLVGCPGDGGGQQGPQGPTGPGNGPLSALESSPFMNEAWITDDGQQIPVLFYARENVRMSAFCRNPAGQINCDAMRYLRNGIPIEISHRSIDGRTSAGVKVCMRMNQPVVRVHNQMGSEDSMCRFPDGSLVSTNALEHYGMRVTEP